MISDKSRPEKSKRPSLTVKHFAKATGALKLFKSHSFSLKAEFFSSLGDTAGNIYLPMSNRRNMFTLRFLLLFILLVESNKQNLSTQKVRRNSAGLGNIHRKQRDSVRRRQSTRLNQAQEDSFLVWMKPAGIYVFCSGFVFCSSCANSAGSR